MNTLFEWNKLIELLWPLYFRYLSLLLLHFHISMSVQATNEMIETKHQQQQQQKSRRYHSMYNENDI
ncbi:hypothetical protein DERP_009699 [Dermatophagoides pteronyssinus]|uniref:Uncharacterized protein n=1 Tax=Dermatophagoides pteronyssinus TaxID=6956 RepID=A0ABQ8JAK9_DERPT|nr:hypothetical protein DERP_009699 [Dermatophagoides pteronyssinus]